jgi:putative ABC transport system permease protein
VRSLVEAQGAESIKMVPVVMARLRAIDGRSSKELAAERKGGRRSSWRFTRAQRLTWMEALPDDNVVVAGELWNLPDVAEISLEEGFAEDLGVGLGAVLTFDVQGVPLDVTVTSLRTVEWESFGINFFLIVEPGLLPAEAPLVHPARGPPEL